MSSTTTERVVRAYFATVADLASTEDDLRPLLHDDAVVVEHPNPVTPTGARRTTAEVLTGFASGKALLSEQSFDVHEVLVAGERAAVRATWRGVVGQDRGSFAAGTVLTAEMAGFLTVRDERVVEHETFDCYPPFGS
ncbi:nuclear transport factor 2 family protein [Nocardioides sp. SYSU D00038]|uniref:nuclear transport factor 2 family protein n=1 Tax=Nocardioides sp. SYSU D00038 TaxID=2812554 RepID=UPI0019672B1E|nr:nuclear transport factor 2 family protein [Nocardioides sp. SYSU D00038]